MWSKQIQAWAEKLAWHEPKATRTHNLHSNGRPSPNSCSCDIARHHSCCDLRAGLDESPRAIDKTAKAYFAMDPQLLLFRRQYLQLVEPDFLAWPPKQLLRDAGAQLWLYKKLFDSERTDRLPPERYQLRVLKSLLAKIEQATEDPEEDVGDFHFSYLCCHQAALLFPFPLPSSSDSGPAPGNIR